MSKGTQIAKGLAKYHQSLMQQQQQIVQRKQQITYKNYQDMLAMSQLQSYINVLHSRYATAIMPSLNTWQYVCRYAKHYQLISYLQERTVINASH